MYKMMACTGCACLCDDVEVKQTGDKSFEVLNACAKGKKLIDSTNNQAARAKYLVRGKETDKETALESALQLIKNSERFLIFGLDNSTTEAQATGIGLAQKRGAVIDDCSSYCHGPLIEQILRDKIHSASLSVAKECDLIIYWGSNPFHSHPRHLSLFSYYSHEDFSVTGWIPEATLCAVETRETELTGMCDRVFKLPPGGDNEFLKAVLMRGQGTDESKAFVKLVEESNKTIIFAGLGLTHALCGDYEQYGKMIESFDRPGEIYTLPMVDHYNMRGFNHQLYGKTGYVNRVSFGGNAVESGRRFSFLAQLNNETVDCALIIGSDPVSNLPRSLVKKLFKIPVILMDPMTTSTTSAAHVAIPVAVSGVESGGGAVRMGGESVKLTQISNGHEYITDLDVLRFFLEGVSR